MLKLLFLRAALFSMMSILFFSCITPSKVAGKVQANPAIVPADFNPKRHILLISEIPRFYYPDQTSKMATEKLDKALKQYCPYKYEIVPLNEINDKSKYVDTSVYKYAILNFVERSLRTNAIVVQFRFFDRVTGKHYDYTRNDSQNLDIAIAAFMEIIKKTRG
jgi:hypothetical protein